MGIEVDIEVRVYKSFSDEPGIVRTFPANSYVRAMIDLLSVHMRQTTLVGMQPTSGGTVTNAISGSTFACVAGSAVDTEGIVVGTGTTAVAIADSALVTKISHGTAAGSLEYQALIHTAPATTAGTRRFSLSRDFVNSTAATITITEVALYGLGAAATTVYCLDRTLPAGGIAVPASSTATLKYWIKTSV